MGKEEIKDLRKIVRDKNGLVFVNQHLIKELEIFKKSHTKKSKIDPTKAGTPNLIYIEFKKHKFLIEPDGDGSWVMINEGGRVMCRAKTKKDIIRESAMVIGEEQE